MDGVLGDNEGILHPDCGGVYTNLHSCSKIKITLHQMTTIKSECMENLLEFD